MRLRYLTVDIIPKRNTDASGSGKKGKKYLPLDCRNTFIRKLYDSTRPYTGYYTRRERPIKKKSARSPTPYVYTYIYKAIKIRFIHSFARDKITIIAMKKEKKSKISAEGIYLLNISIYILRACTSRNVELARRRALSLSPLSAAEAQSPQNIRSCALAHTQRRLTRPDIHGLLPLLLGSSRPETWLAQEG